MTHTNFRSLFENRRRRTVWGFSVSDGRDIVKALQGVSDKKTALEKITSLVVMRINDANRLEKNPDRIKSKDISTSDMKKNIASLKHVVNNMSEDDHNKVSAALDAIGT